MPEREFGIYAFNVAAEEGPTTGPAWQEQAVGASGATAVARTPDSFLWRQPNLRRHVRWVVESETDLWETLEGLKLGGTPATLYLANGRQLSNYLLNDFRPVLEAHTSDGDTTRSYYRYELDFIEG